MYTTPYKKRTRSLTPNAPRKKASKFSYNRNTTLAAKVNRILSSEEKKNFDVLGSIVLAPNVATITPLTTILQGDSATARDGRKICLKSVQSNYQITVNTNASWRIVVVMDRQSNGTGPLAGDILEVATNVRSPLNLANAKRFVVLHDNYLGLGKGMTFFTTTGAGGTKNPGKFFKALDETMEFGTAAEPTTGGVYMLTLAEDIGTQIHYTRSRFTDS